jgi:hypothetical protein
MSRAPSRQPSRGESVMLQGVASTRSTSNELAQGNSKSDAVSTSSPSQTQPERPGNSTEPRWRTSKGVQRLHVEVGDKLTG